MSQHTSHPDIVKRLKRAEGHLRGVIEMIESGRSCLDVAQQLSAVTKALENAKAVFIHDHIDHCLEHAVDAPERDAKAAIREFKEITKYL